MFSSRTARGLLTESKTILMNYSCLALVLKSKHRLKPRRYTDGTSRVLPFPIPLLLYLCFHQVVDLLHLVIHVGHKESACFIKWISPTQVMTFNYYDQEYCTLLYSCYDAIDLPKSELSTPSPQQGSSTCAEGAP